MYKYDVHVHTAEISPCGKVSAKKIVSLYKQVGYDGVVITDHFHKRCFDKLSGKTWEEKVDNFFSGYRKAYCAGKKMSLKVWAGIEICFLENANDYLVFGLTSNYLKKHKNLFQLGFEKFTEVVSDTNCLIYQAHPFRNIMTRAKPSLLDGIEVYNGNKRQNNNNRKAYSYAVKNNLKMISGSDFHEIEDLGQGGIILPKKINSILELITQLKEKKLTLKNLIIN